MILDKDVLFFQLDMAHLEVLADRALAALEQVDDPRMTEKMLEQTP